MITASIPQDIRRYKTKFAGNFSLREFICLVIAGVISLIAYNIQKLWTTEPVLEACAICIVPLLFGFIPKSITQGLTLEQYLKCTFVSNYLSAKHRIYKRENVFRQFTSNNLVTADFDQQNDEPWTECGLNQMTEKEKKASKKEKKELAKSNPEIYKGY